jgi:hypothetical protein
MPIGKVSVHGNLKGPKHADVEMATTHHRK